VKGQGADRQHDSVLEEGETYSMTVELDEELEGIDKENLDCHIEQCNCQEPSIRTVFDSHDLIRQFQSSDMYKRKLSRLDLYISTPHCNVGGTYDSLLS
jgi:hypothetical protein